MNDTKGLRELRRVPNRTRRQRIKCFVRKPWTLSCNRVRFLRSSLLVLFPVIVSQLFFSCWSPHFLNFSVPRLRHSTKQNWRQRTKHHLENTGSEGLLRKTHAFCHGVCRVHGHINEELSNSVKRSTKKGTRTHDKSNSKRIKRTK